MQNCKALSTASIVRDVLELTSNAGKQLASKVLDMAVWERGKGIGLEEIENAHAK
jgi:hypothetical protein